MNNVQVIINPTEIKSLNFNNTFTQKPGEKIELKVKSEVAIRLSTTNPVAATVLVKVNVEDEASHSISLQLETITGIVVSTFVDNLDQYIKANYLPVVMMAANEKVRSITAMMGIPIKVPNPRFGAAPEKPEEDNGFLQ